VVVDDAEQGVTEIVRGADLLASAPRQIYLQRLLGFSLPSYLHLPAVLNAQREKLSKQTRSEPLTRAEPVPMLWQALAFLGQSPPPEWRSATRVDFWAAAATRWSEACIPRQSGIVLNSPVYSQ
jgi:glutamyl-Q tRNA(Asp) synthetase